MSQATDTSGKWPQMAITRVANSLGFKLHNLFLWFVFGGALFGLCLSALEDYDLDGRYCGNYEGLVGLHGDCYWFQRQRRTKVGFCIHVFAVVPAGLLAVFQFIPTIRHKALLYHRMAGYTIISLIILGNAGILVMARNILGGDVALRTLLGTIVILTTGGLGIAIYNVKRQQLDQHRAWMLRTWFWLGFIVTFRIIQAIMISVLAIWPSQQYNTPILCDQLLFVFRHNITQLHDEYPSCAPEHFGVLNHGMTLVTSDPSSPAGLVAIQNSTFVAAGALAFFLHAIGVELYLALTPREAQRLRQVSYERQLERGMRHPGSAGLVPERLGDSDPWQPKAAISSPQSVDNSSEVHRANGKLGDVEITRADPV